MAVSGTGLRHLLDDCRVAGRCTYADCLLSFYFVHTDHFLPFFMVLNREHSEVLLGVGLVLYS